MARNKAALYLVLICYPNELTLSLLIAMSRNIKTTLLFAIMRRKIKATYKIKKQDKDRVVKMGATRSRDMKTLWSVVQWRYVRGSGQYQDTDNSSQVWIREPTEYKLCARCSLGAWVISVAHSVRLMQQSRARWTLLDWVWLLMAELARYSRQGRGKYWQVHLTDGHCSSVGTNWGA